MTLDMPRHKLKNPSVLAIRYVAWNTPVPIEEPGLIICILVCAPRGNQSAALSHIGGGISCGKGAAAAHLDRIDRVHYAGSAPGQVEASPKRGGLRAELGSGLTCAVLGNAGEGAGSHVLQQREVGRERFITVAELADRYPSRCVFPFRRGDILVVLHGLGIWLSHCGSYGSRRADVKSQVEDWRGRGGGRSVGRALWW